MRYQKGVALLSLVGILTVLTIAAIVGVVAYSQQQAKLPNEVVDRQVNQMFTFASALSRCYHDYRDWRLCDENRVVTYYPSNSPTGVGYVAMNGSPVSWVVVPGAGSPEEDLDISFSMTSTDSARRISRLLPNARVNGNQVTWTLDPPTETVDHVNQIARYADNVYERQTNGTPSDNRNQVEIDLSFGQDDDTVDERQSLNNLQRVDIDQLNLAKVDDSDTQGGTLTISERLTIEEQDEALRQTNQGTADIYVQDGVLQVDTQTAVLSGSAQVEGLTVQGHFISQGDVVVEQGAQFGGSTTVGESLEVEQDVTIRQDATFNGALSVMARLQADSLSVSGQIESRGNEGFVGDDFCIRKGGQSDICLNQSHNDAQVNERQRILNRRGYVNTEGDSGEVDNIDDNQAERIANASSAERNRRQILINRQGFVTNPGDSNAAGVPPLNINDNRARIDQNERQRLLNQRGYFATEGDSGVVDNATDNETNSLDNERDSLANRRQSLLNQRGYVTTRGDSGEVDNATDNETNSLENRSQSLINRQGYVDVSGDSDVNGRAPDNIDDNERDSIANQIAIDRALADLRSCVTGTRYCIPERPLINSPRCQGCVQDLRGPVFTATISASISGCRQGCLYRWTVDVPDLVESCNNATGSVSPGSFMDVSCVIRANDLDPQEDRRGVVRLFVENRVYGDNSRFTTTRTFDIDWTNTTPLEPNVSVSCGADCDVSRTISSFSATVRGTIDNCPQGCTYSWSVSGGASASCSGGSVGRGGRANPSCSISANLDAQEGASGSVRLTARNSVNPSAQDSDATGYDFFNRTPAFQNCSATTRRLSVTGSSPPFFHDERIPALAHGREYTRSRSGLRPPLGLIGSDGLDACGGAGYGVIAIYICDDGVVRNNDLAAGGGFLESTGAFCQF